MCADEPSPEPLEWSTPEPEGWPYDGGVDTLRRFPDGRLELEQEFRHIDADGPRVEHRELEPRDAARWLAIHDPHFLRVADFLPELLAEAATLHADGPLEPPGPEEPARHYLRRLAPGLYFSETVWVTTARPPGEVELALRIDFPALAKAWTWVQDAWDGGQVHPPRQVVRRDWVSPAQARRLLQDSGVPEEEAARLCPDPPP